MTMFSVLKHTIYVLLAISFATLAQAQEELSAPSYVDYQGKVFGPNARPLGSIPSGNGFVASPDHYEMEFRIFDDQTGGKLIWAEHQIVTVSMGDFSVRLGAGAPINTAPAGTKSGAEIAQSFNGKERYLEVTVKINGEGRAIVPRLAFQSSPFSFTSMRAVEALKANHADVAAKVTDPNVAMLDRPIQTFTNTTTEFTGQVGIGVAPTEGSGFQFQVQNAEGGAKLQIGDTTSSGQQRIITFGDSELVFLGENGVDDRLDFKASKFYFADGNVSIGTTDATAKLNVAGDIKLGTNSQFYAPEAEEKVRIIRGVVGRDASTVAGAGWTSTRVSAGIYRVDFTTPFLSTPTVVATSHTSNDYIADYVISVSRYSTTSFEINMRRLSTAALFSQPWHFIAIGGG
jgi:hypothetical protein